MTASTVTRWQRWKYWLNGLLLIAPIWFFYDGLTPEFPPAWPERTVGPFTATPTPADDGPPYRHDGDTIKDFSMRFCDGCWAQMRTAYLSAGDRPNTLPADGEGVLHGHGSLQHVHVPYPLQPDPDDRLWLTVQTWDGQVYQTDWPLPEGER